MNHIWLYHIVTECGYNSNIFLGGIAMFIIDTEFANADIARTIRFTEKIFNELNETADKNGISFNLLVLQCCRYALDQLDESKE